MRCPLYTRWLKRGRVVITQGSSMTIILTLSRTRAENAHVRQALGAPAAAWPGDFARERAA